MAWHDLNDKIGNKRDYLAEVRLKNLTAKGVKDFEESFCDGIKEETQYRIVTEKNFSALVLIDYVFNRYKPVEVYLAIFRINLAAVNRLKEIIDNSNCKFTILISSFFVSNEKYEMWARQLENYCYGKENVELKFAWSHAKVMLIKTDCGRHFVFEGSGNVSHNAKIEQYLIEDRIDTYNFHKNWINETVGKRRKRNDN
jgi:hypothetical protein